MGKWLAQTPKQMDLASKLLAAGESSRIHVAIDGGSALRARVRTHFNVLEFLMSMPKETPK